jgi:DNA processing protein
LKNLHDAPPLIYVKGNKNILNHPLGVAIVGARNASISSKKLASKIAFDLTNNNILVISGLARGIDSSAHKGALYAKDQKGPTVAIMGTGVDIAYPEENQELYEQICSQGAVISEYLLGTQPQTSNFPRRNRLVSALSSAILVVEASENSGSLITAKLGLEQGKDIFAVPSFPIEGKSLGTNKLIKDGAVLTECAKDILDVLYFSQSKQIKDFKLYQQTLFAKTLDKAKKSDNIPLKVTDSSLQSLISLIDENGIEIDELIRLAGNNTVEVMAKITELELDDIIERVNTNTLILKNKTKKGQK